MFINNYIYFFTNTINIIKKKMIFKYLKLKL